MGIVMNDIVVIALVLVGLAITTLLGLRFTRTFKPRDTFDQWRRSSGKMLPDYDVEQNYVDKYSK